jgi:hypothetical protein
MDIARKIVISRWPEVYHMSQDEFNDWVLSLSPEDENWIERKIVNVLFKENFATMEEVDNYIDGIDLADKGVLNKEKLYYTGIGPNFFTFNEQDNKGLLLNNKTLYDYDRSEFLNREEIIAEHTKKPPNKNYEYLNLFHDWCRLSVNDRLVYGSLDSLSAYVYSVLEDFLDVEVDKIYPHKMVYGKDHGKPEGDGFLWDMVRDANGKERHLEELSQKIYHDFFYRDFHDEIVRHCESLALDCVFVKRGKDEDGVSDFFYFIFTDRDVAKRIRLDNFYDDVLKNESTNWQEVEKVIEKLQRKLLKKLTECYEAVEKEVQENVIPFRGKKRNKIVVSGQLLDVLGEDSDDDND